MQNPQLAFRYAKSLLNESIQKDQLKEVFKDMNVLRDICTKNDVFIQMLKSPIIPNEKKGDVLRAVLKGKFSEITARFLRLIAKKHRESYFLEMVNAFIDLYKENQKIYKVRLTTAVPISEELKQFFIKKIKADTSMQKIELESVVRKELIGGFILEYGDQLADASVSYELGNSMKLFRKNDFIFRLR